jgi:hypothetical protein
MSLLGSDDVLGVRVYRKINGKRHVERVDIRASDVRYLSTPELLRHFSGCIDTAVTRLDAIEEYSQPQPVSDPAATIQDDFEAAL